MKKYILLRAFHIPRIFILCHYFSLRIIASSYHEKIYLTQGFSYTSDFYMSLYYFSLRIIVSSYHEKIYLTQGLSYTSDFYIMSLFFTSYHSIIVSRKNISYSGPFIYLGFFILCHCFSLRIVVSSYHEKPHIPWIFIYLYMRSIHFT